MAKTKVALITGISGQDGSYLTEYLLELGYEVHGVVRRHSVAENQSARLLDTNDKITTHYGDLLDEHSLYKIMNEVKPDEIYNLAAMSQVRISSDIPSFTLKTNALGVLNMLEVYKNVVPEAKFYQASSSEMFGNTVDDDGFQRLTTPMNPVSPYGCAKLYAYNLCRTYRASYNMFISNGKKNNPIKNMLKDKIYTHFIPKISSLDAKKKWIIGSLNSSGKIYIDQGAWQALSNGKSLLAAGITKIIGSFKKGENVLVIDQYEKHLARGLASFNSEEIDKVKGKQSKEIEKILGYLSKSEIIHKDDMVLL